jgi:hypothetical protein
MACPGEQLRLGSDRRAVAMCVFAVSAKLRSFRSR